MALPPGWRNSSSLASCLALWAQLAALVLFLVGFFPVKQPADGNAALTDVPHWKHGVDASSMWSQRHVGQLVIVLVDALRADFVLDRSQINDALGIADEEGNGHENLQERPKMDYLARMLADGKAVAALAEGKPPTVTLPRIKALMTGSIPGFVDVALNLGSSALTEDSLVAQWLAAGRKLTLFGDDTWAKLFPEAFVRADGVTSFFVADYTEVDDNVTRHLDGELSRDDWDVCVLHYLGLDHIGHLAGPSSPLIAPKLKEMGDVVEKIVDALQAKPWKDSLPPLVVVLGDHGMSDAGSHGGASAPEIRTPVVFIGSAVKATSKVGLIRQHDLTPTLSALTGVPIPAASIGAMLPSAVAKRFSEDSLADGAEALAGAWLYNADTVARNFRKNVKDYEDDLGHQRFVKARKLLESKRNLTSSELSSIATELRRAARDMGDHLANNVLEYDVGVMAAAIAINVLILIWCAVHYLPSTRSSSLSRIVLAFELLKIVSLGSTSFVEEQHQTMYFLHTTTVLLLSYYGLLARRKRDVKGTGTGAKAVELEEESAARSTTTHPALALATPLLWLTLFRVLRRWNSTGDKWAGLPDAADWLDGPDRKPHLSVLHGVCLAALGLRTVIASRRLTLPTLALVSSYFLVLGHHAAKGAVSLGGFFDGIWSERGITEARLVYLLSASAFVLPRLLAARTRPRDPPPRPLDCLLPVLALLSQPHNVALLVAFFPAAEVLARLVKAVSLNLTAPQEDLAVVAFSAFTTLGSSIYFMQGNSNSLATVDVGACYSGLSAYSPVAVGFLMAVNTYGGHVLAWIGLNSEHSGRPHPKSSSSSPSSLLALQRSSELCFFAVLVTSQRHHLFVWTVFAPKLIYEASLGLVVAVVVTAAEAHAKTIDL